MITWEALTWYQKAAFWLVIGVVGWFSPEIALLFHFGGVEVVFAFLAVYFVPVIRQIHGYIQKIKQSMLLAFDTCRTSASATPKVFSVQATFCCVAFVLTGSVTFAMFFFLPGLALNGILV